MLSEKINILGDDVDMLTTRLANMGLDGRLATKLLRWIHKFGCCDFTDMVDIKKSFRASLSEHFAIRLPTVFSEKQSTDGTVKWLLKLTDGQMIETVLIPEGKRYTLCISSQVGCALNCRFCATGLLGFKRHLKASEIIAQVWLASRYLANSCSKSRLTNVVFMGMGEPLLNVEQLLLAISILTHDHGYGLSKYRVTVSSAGIVPGIYALAEKTDVALAISLHAARDALRNQLVPINKKYHLQRLLKACSDYFKPPSKRKIVMEYIMLAGINDSNRQAQELAELLATLPCKVNLIPFNPVEAIPFRCSNKATINRFASILKQQGLVATIRKTRGQDIDASCGQLAALATSLSPMSLSQKQRSN